MNNKEQAVLDLCVDIYAHLELDWEIDLAGNGTNPSEASNVADVLKEIFEFNEDEFSELANKRIEELENA
jgi:hypothetical protein